MMELEHLIEVILPPIVSICEIIGIIVVVVSVFRAFYHYLHGLFTHTKEEFEFDLACGLAAGLEFKMAAEILNTVLVESLTELAVLGAVIVLRGLLSFLIHFEMKHSLTLK